MLKFPQLSYTIKLFFYPYRLWKKSYKKACMTCNLIVWSNLYWSILRSLLNLKDLANFKQQNGEVGVRDEHMQVESCHSRPPTNIYSQTIAFMI